MPPVVGESRNGDGVLDVILLPYVTLAISIRLMLSLVALRKRWPISRIPIAWSHAQMKWDRHKCLSLKTCRPSREYLDRYYPYCGANDPDLRKPRFFSPLG